MADVKTLQTRISLKYDSYDNWSNTEVEGKGGNLVLLPGELGICEVPATNVDSNVAPTVLFKVGGAKYTAEDAAAGKGTEGELMKFKDLPWASAKAADVYGWAKKSEEDFKKWLDKTAGFATDAEVEALVAPERARIAALEAKFGENDGTIDKQIEALKGRLDIIEGGEDVEGSIDNAIKVANAYTDNKAADIKTAYEKYADDKDVARKTYIDNEVETLEAADAELAGRLDVIEGDAETEGSIAKAIADAVVDLEDYADQVEVDAVEAAKDYTDEVIGDKAVGETAATGIRKEIADAEAAAKAYTDTAVSTQATVDAAQNAEIEKKLDKADYEAYIAGKSMSDADLKKYAEDEADAAEAAAIAAAIAAAKTETEKQVKAFKDSDFSDLSARVAGIDEAYKAADTTLGNKITAIEDKLADVTNVMDFVGAGAELPETAQKGDVYVINEGDDAGKEFVYDGTAWVEFGFATANETAIANLQDRMDTAEDAIDDLEAVVAAKLASGDFDTWKQSHENDHANKQSAITEAINAEKTARETAINGINNKIGTADDAVTAATVYGAIAAAKQAGIDADAKAAGAVGRLDLVEPKVTTLQDIVNGYTDKGSIKTAIEAAASAAATADGKAVAADEKAVDAQTRVGVLETTTVPGVKTIAENAQTRVAAVEVRMTDAEGNITTLQNIVSGYTDAGSVKAAIDAAANAASVADGKAVAAQQAADKAQGEVDALETVVAGVKTTAEDAQTRVAAIEADYVKATDLVNDYYIFNCGSSTTVVHENAAN